MLSKNLLGATAAFGMLAAATAALALVAPPAFAPREFQTQQTHYLRFSVDFNSCVIPAGAATCQVKVGALPYNAWLTAIRYNVRTVFNPTTSATISLGTGTVAAGTSANIQAAQNVFTGVTLGAVGYVACGTSCGAIGTFAGIGMAATGSGATPTGVDGGFEVYVLYTTGANGSQGTTGHVDYVIEYIGPNDGQCAPVPLGSTAVSC